MRICCGLAEILHRGGLVDRSGLPSVGRMERIDRLALVGGLCAKSSPDPPWSEGLGSEITSAQCSASLMMNTLGRRGAPFGEKAVYIASALSSPALERLPSHHASFVVERTRRPRLEGVQPRDPTLRYTFAHLVS
jgi:hypothetical protein